MTRPILLAIIVLFSVAARAEMPLSPLQYSPALGSQQTPVLASDGDRHLLAWVDFRSQPLVLASRVGDDGALLDPTGIALSDPVVPYVSLSFRPAIRRDDDGWLVQWSHAGGELWQQRVTDDGTVAGRPVRGVSTAQVHPDIDPFRPQLVASDGSDLLVIGHRPQSSELTAVRFDSDGVVYAPVFFHSGVTFGALRSLYWDGEQYVLITAIANGIQAVRLDRGGHPRWPQIELAANAFGAAVSAPDEDGTVAIVFLRKASPTRWSGRCGTA